MLMLSRNSEIIIKNLTCNKHLWEVAYSNESKNIVRYYICVKCFCIKIVRKLTEKHYYLVKVFNKGDYYKSFRLRK